MPNFTLKCVIEIQKNHMSTVRENDNIGHFKRRWEKNDKNRHFWVMKQFIRFMVFPFCLKMTNRID